MTLRLHLASPVVRRFGKFIVFVAMLIFPAYLTQTTAQCIEHPEKKTAVIFNNESSFDLTFFVDEDEVGIAVPSRTASSEVEVAPGEHLLRAKAVVQSQVLWFWIVSHIPKSKICTWTATDPQRIKDKENYNDTQ